MAASPTIRIFGPRVASFAVDAQLPGTVASTELAVAARRVPLVRGTDASTVATNVLLVGSEALLATWMGGLVVVGALGLLRSML
jgi:hypothetical protein